MSQPEPQPVPSPVPSTGHPTPDVDVEKLADKVYRLMVADLRLEISRFGATIARR